VSRIPFLKFCKAVQVSVKESAENIRVPLKKYLKKNKSAVKTDVFTALF